jgi:uncharacterized protein YaaR (DUF327 family)
MRVVETGDSHGESAGAVKGRSRRRTAARGAVRESDFDKTLAVVRVEAVKESLDQLLTDLDQAAETLKKTRTVGALARYRELVQSFVKKVVGESYEVRQEGGFDRKGRRRVYLLVQKINTALEQLADSLLSAHAESLSLLDKLGEIRGMLVDLYT